jgi:sulfonate transport system substrate-binding protein
VKDPFYTKNHLSDKEIEAFVDRRFFAGGEYFVDTSRNPKATAEAAPNGRHQVERQVALGLR